MEFMRKGYHCYLFGKRNKIFEKKESITNHFLFVKNNFFNFI